MLTVTSMILSCSDEIAELILRSATTFESGSKWSKEEAGEQ